MSAFGTTNETQICKEILLVGELQVSGKERQTMLESQMNSIVNSVAALCVNPETRHPYSSTMIEKSLKEAHFSLKPNKNIKQQTLEAIKILMQRIPIERSRMKLRVSFPAKKEAGVKLKDSLIKLAAAVENEECIGDEIHMILLIDPGNYRPIDELMRRDTKGKCLIELLELKEVMDSDELF